MVALNEADTCRRYVLPKLVDAEWDSEPHSFTEQKSFTDGRIVVAGSQVRRKPQKRADYLLRYTRDFPIAVVEAKAAYKTAGAGLQQAKEYAEILGLSFAYSTNGEEIVEFDYNLDLKNPRGRVDFEHLPPEQLVEDILAKERRIFELVGEIKQALA